MTTTTRNYLILTAVLLAFMVGCAPEPVIPWQPVPPQPAAAPEYPHEGQAIDAASQTFDSTKIDGPAGVRNWLVSKYSDLFMTVASEKLLTYALGRGLQYQDMTLVRSIAREAVKSDGRFSSLVLGIVKSKPFQMNIKTAGAATSTARANRWRASKAPSRPRVRRRPT